MRLLASLGRYVVTHDPTGLQVHLYNTGRVELDLNAGGRVVLSMQTDYPWQGDVKLRMEETNGAPWQLRLRIPEWSATVRVAINGQPVEQPALEQGYLVLGRMWQPGDEVELALAMEPFLVEAHPRVDAVRGSVALQRGPLVYCLEGIDHPHLDIMDVRLDTTAPLTAVWHDDLAPGGLMAIRAAGYALDRAEWNGRLYRRVNRRNNEPRQPVTLTAIPYFAWANRGSGAMRVWIPGL
jgi:DUF1680 family protein